MDDIKIICKNTFTFFNVINFFLAVLVLSVDSYRNLFFMGVVISNIVIASFQEIRSRRELLKLSIITAPKAVVIRGGEDFEIDASQLRVGDIVRLSIGGQIPTDCTLISGETEVNESLITGESDPVIKGEGDVLLAGSFLVSGRCTAEVMSTSEESYGNKIAESARVQKETDSEIIKSLNRLVKIVAFTIIPMGLIMFYKQFVLLENNFDDSILTTVASLISMIPEGLILITSIVFAVSIIKLSKERTLVHDLYCVENMARVDVLCLDKTGTITEGDMRVSGVVPLNDTDEGQISIFISALNRYSSDNSATGLAILKEFGDETDWVGENFVDFSSKRKWRGVSFKEKGSVILGAGEFVLGEDFSYIKEDVELYSKDGTRVLVLAHSSEPLQNKELPKNVKAIAIIMIEDKIRENAKETLEYFARENIEVKIFSGDNAVATSNIGKKVGLKNWDRCVNVTQIGEDLGEVLENNTVFGRVSPEQKLEFIKTLKEKGHTVAMIGDGVNDVLALREADCSVAMASGSEAVRCVSNLVLLDSNFSALPKILEQGRGAINNLERTGSLFLVKTIYSVILGLVFIFANESYPFLPIHLTLNSSLVIGIPSFIFAFEMNKERVSGSFIKNIFLKAMPASFTTVFGIVIMIIIKEPMGLTSQEFSTASVVVLTAIGLIELWKISLPINIFRVLLLTAMSSGSVLAFTVFRDLFFFTLITKDMAVAIIIAVFVSALVFILLSKLEKNQKFIKYFSKKWKI